MAYTLLTSERSPFGRICRMFMLTNSIPFTLDVANFVDDPAQAARVAKANPINKVPVLVDGTQSVFDSRVIINHLSHKHNVAALSLDQENFVSAAYSIMETSVIFFLLKNDGVNVDGPENFFRRNRDRITATLKYLTPWAANLDPRRDWNYATMSLYACLDWAERRPKTLTLADHPKLSEFVRKFAEAPGVVETKFY